MAGKMMVKPLSLTTVLTWGLSILMFIGPAPLGAEERLELTKLEVTGSRIPRAETEGLVPLALFDRETIERSGASSTNEFFRDMVFNTAGVIDEQFTQGFAPGTSSIDLRGLGVNRTLVLLDGRRLPIYPFGRLGTQSFVDINSIPLSAIERIEVLKDGASAIYGADAVAGVVNIITRKDQEGFGGSLQYGKTDEGDGEEGHLGAVVGKNWEKTNLTFTVDYFSRDPIEAKDRDISKSADGPIDDRSLLGRPGTWIPLSTGLPQADTSCPADQILSQGPAQFCGYDFAPWVTLVPETKRLGLLGNLDHEIGDSMRLFARAMYSYSYSERDLAPANNGASPFFVSQADPLNPLGEDILVLYRLEELGPRRDEFETNVYNILAGIGGYAGSWDWELAAGYGRVDAEVKGVNGYARAADLQAAVDAGTLNLFGPSPSFNANSISYTTKRDGKSELYFGDAKATGEIYELANGPVQLAIGAEVRKEEFSDEFDEVTESGAILGVGGVSADGDRDSQSVFAEISIPARDDLELQLAGRFDHYSDFGDTFNPKVGLRWQPRDDLLVRASAGTGFKAPALHELYSGDVIGVDSVIDNGTLVSNVHTVTTGNPDLDAEESESVNLGFVWDITPQWDLSIDGWYLKNSDAVSNSPQYILDNEASFPDLVERDINGDLVSITSPFQNIAARRLWGIDLDTHIEWKTRQAGRFRVGVLASYLGSFEEEGVAGGGYEELAGTDGRPRLRTKTNAVWQKAAYAGSLTVNYIGGYDRRNVDDPKYDAIDSWTTVDAQFSWTPPSLAGGRIVIGVKNLFDEEPPNDPFAEGWPFFNRALHNPRGRFGYLRYERSF
jgi:outer membrane receptor protein involved in Fe transport